MNIMLHRLKAIGIHSMKYGENMVTCEMVDAYTFIINGRTIILNKESG